MREDKIMLLLVGEFIIIGLLLLLLVRTERDKTMPASRQDLRDGINALGTDATAVNKSASDAATRVSTGTGSDTNDYTDELTALQTVDGLLTQAKTVLDGIAPAPAPAPAPTPPAS